MPGEHGLWRDVADGAVQTDIFTHTYVIGHVVYQDLAYRFNSILNRGLRIELPKQTGVWDQASRQIWPIEAGRITWPAEYLGGLVAGARRGDVGEAGVEEARVDAGIGVNEGRVRGKALAAVTGNGVAVVEMTMLADV